MDEKRIREILNEIMRTRQALIDLDYRIDTFESWVKGDKETIETFEKFKEYYRELARVKLDRLTTELKLLSESSKKE